MAGDRILIVEDEAIVARDIHDALLEMGYEVSGVASSGESAIKKAEDENPDLILMDLRLSGEIDGVKAADIIRENYDVPVIYLTAYSDDATLQRAKVTQPFGYLLKPVIPKELQSAIEIALFRHRSEKQMKENSRWFAATLACIGDGVIATDRLGNIKFINPAAERMTHWNQDAAIGQTFDWVFDLSSGDKADSHDWADILEDCTFRRQQDGWLHTRNKLSIPIRYSASPIADEKNNVLGMVFVFQDMSELQKAEELVFHNARLKTIADLAGGVAHNFNNVLQIVISGLQVMMMDPNAPLPEESAVALQAILDTCKSGSEMVKRLQDFSKLSSEDAVTQGKVFDLSRTVRQLISIYFPGTSMWRSEFKKKSVTIRPSLQPGCFIRGSEGQMFEVIYNLLKNATEAIDSRGEILVGAKTEGDDVVLRITDSGKGISEADKERVFDPFWTSKGFQRAGLGLSGAYGIVKRHGGAIAIESAENAGTTVTVTIPRETQGRRSEPENAVCSSGAGKYTVLVIDDLEPVVKTIQGGLKNLGFEVFTACSGSQGIELYMTQTPDVVVCDLGMEGLSGWDVNELIKNYCAEQNIPKTPLILLTGWGELAGSMDIQDQASVERIVEKPVEINRLADIIREFIEN
jgi:two-component system, cell cycle sensor histidine kinase and response regulator CckA